MTFVLWGIQILLGLVFLMVGIMKAIRPIEALAKRMTWVQSVPTWFVRFIGVAEIAGGIGLILPAATKILPWLTVGAAIGIGVVMVSALILHTSRKEYSRLGGNVVLLALALFIVVGRLAWAPF